MFSVQNLPSLLKHAIISSFVYIIAKPTLTPNISLPFILSIAIAQFMDLQEKCGIIHGQFFVSNVLFLLGQFCIRYTQNNHIIGGGNSEFAIANKNNKM